MTQIGEPKTLTQTKYYTNHNMSRGAFEQKCLRVVTTVIRACSIWAPLINGHSPQAGAIIKTQAYSWD